MQDESISEKQTAVSGATTRGEQTTFVGIAERTEPQMQVLLRFERLLADLSASFVNLPAEQIDLHIDNSLRTLVGFLGNDRSTLVEFGEDETQVLVTHSYAVPGCSPFPLGPFEPADTSSSGAVVSWCCARESARSLAKRGCNFSNATPRFFARLCRPC